MSQKIQHKLLIQPWRSLGFWDFSPILDLLGFSRILRGGTFSGTTDGWSLKMRNFPSTLGSFAIEVSFFQGDYMKCLGCWEQHMWKLILSTLLRSEVQPFLNAKTPRLRLFPLLAADNRACSTWRTLRPAKQPWGAHPKQAARLDNVSGAVQFATKAASRRRKMYEMMKWEKLTKKRKHGVVKARQSWRLREPDYQSFLKRSLEPRRGHV